MNSFINKYILLANFNTSPPEFQFIVNWTPRNILQWHFDQNTKLFIHKNASEYIVCEIVAILSGVSEWLNLMASLGTVDSEVHIVNISRVITAYTLESLSSLTEIIHNLQAIINFK